jgi:hypothetical protein
MRDFSVKFYYNQKPLIASHMEFLLQKAYFKHNEKLYSLCANQLSLSSVVTIFPGTPYIFPTDIYAPNSRIIYRTAYCVPCSVFFAAVLPLISRAEYPVLRSTWLTGHCLFILPGSVYLNPLWRLRIFLETSLLRAACCGLRSAHCTSCPALLFLTAFVEVSPNEITKAALLLRQRISRGKCYL